MARRHPGRPQSTCDPPGHPSSATPPESSNSNSTSDSPLRLPTQTERWRQLLATEVPSATADPFLPELAERLTISPGPASTPPVLVRSAAAAGPLPDDHPAAALWWRILDQLPQTPNQDPATPEAVPATRRTTTTSREPAATQAALGTASRVRPEPLKPRLRTHHDA